MENTAATQTKPDTETNAMENIPAHPTRPDLDCLDFASESARVRRVVDFLRGYRTDVETQKREIDEIVDYDTKHFRSADGNQYIELVMSTDMQAYLAGKVKDVHNALDKPYFARVDFTEDGEKEKANSKQRLYVGKMALMDDAKHEILITDWRAPVSSLYYEGRVGESAYECPDGVISGEISLKRQYTVEKGELQSMIDVDITTNDDFLQAALGASKDKRLKDIVSTIQAEQNRIIRSDLFRPLVVQGAAGSGKTTIALHRIAWLLYTYGERMKARNFMIMAPNRIFLSYISEVLPDLGVENVAQTTFEDFALEYIGQKLKVNPSVDALAEAVETGDYDSPRLRAAGLKSSLRFKGVMEKYCGLIMHNMVPKDSFEVDGYVIIPKEEISRLLLTEYAYLPLSARVGELAKNLRNNLRRSKPWILQGIDDEYDKMKNELKKQMADGDERRAVITSM
ncbi:MAG: AAA family ATPase, partial [Defluviitaleaceae bacterium]|nr:AAA family ATPase [Defluviitaleaceae bacterium]